MLRFSPADLDRFSAVSHDVNPLHMSADYARRTAYGERVVFGVLAALSALAHAKPRPGQRLAHLDLEFPNAVLMGVDYQVVVEQDDDDLRLSVADGRRVLARIRARFTDGPGGEFGDGAGHAPSSVPADQTADDLAPEMTAGGRYGAPAQCRAFAHELGLGARGVAPGQVAAVLWSSYLIGMELPGRRALFSRARFEFSGAGGTEFAYRARVSRFHRRFGRLKIEADLRSGEAAFATVELEAFVRADVPPADVSTIEALLPRGHALAGKTAWVVGGSRGLGAALVRGLALQGATVRVGYARSEAAAQALAAELSGAPGQVELVRGDACDPAFCAAQPTPDILVCSAFPALMPLWVEPTALDRMTDFMHRAWALTATPLAHVAPGLAERGGTLLTISTSAVTQIVPEWPHYTAAKFAIEGLSRAVAAEYPALRTLIARLPKLWTDLTNTPLGRHGAVPIERVAASLTRSIIAGGGGLEVLEDFA